MYDTSQKLTDPSFKVDSLLGEAEYLQSRMADHNRKSREDTIKQRGEGNCAMETLANTVPVKTFISTDTAIGGFVSQSEQCGRLILQAKIYQARCKWYFQPLNISKWLLYIGGFLTCVGYMAVMFDERAEMKQKRSRNMY